MLVYSDVLQRLVNQGIATNLAHIYAQLWEANYRSMAMRASSPSAGLQSIDPMDQNPELGQRAYDLYRENVAEEADPGALRDPSLLGQRGWRLQTVDGAQVLPGDIPPNHVAVPVANVRGQDVIYLIDASGNREDFMRQSALVFYDLAQSRHLQEGATDQERAVFRQILRGLGVRRNDLRRYIPTDQDRQQFAEYFVRYLRTGRAPIEGLQDAFERAARWLIRLVRGVPNGDIPIAMQRALGMVLINERTLQAYPWGESVILPARALTGFLGLSRRRREQLMDRLSRIYWRGDLMNRIGAVFQEQDLVDALEAGQTSEISASDRTELSRLIHELDQFQFDAFLDAKLNVLAQSESSHIQNTPANARSPDSQRDSTKG